MGYYFQLTLSGVDGAEGGRKDNRLTLSEADLFPEMPP